MNVEQLFLAFTLLGSKWVLYLLVLLSVGSIGVMIERALFFRKRAAGALSLRTEAPALIRADKWEELVRLCKARNPGVGLVLASALEARTEGKEAFQQTLAAERSALRQLCDHYLSYLGTLGNNAPFIGLFGTVLGIIKAFHDLSISQEAGPNVVMGGIAEALVATAVGLLVAIPAVVAFNYFQLQTKRLLATVDELGHLVMTRDGRSG